MEIIMKNTIYFTKDDLDKIQKFVDKYPKSQTMSLQADSSSGIGTTLHVTIDTIINDDFVQIRKTISSTEGF